MPFFLLNEISTHWDTVKIASEYDTMGNRKKSQVDQLDKASEQPTSAGKRAKYGVRISWA